MSIVLVLVIIVWVLVRTLRHHAWVQHHMPTYQSWHWEFNELQKLDHLPWMYLDNPLFVLSVSSFVPYNRILLVSYFVEPIILFQFLFFPFVCPIKDHTLFLLNTKNLLIRIVILLFGPVLFVCNYGKLFKIFLIKTFLQLVLWIENQKLM